MAKAKIYLDTSVINFLFADDAPERMEITKDFFANFITTGIYESFISAVVVQEINNTIDNDKREKLLGCISKYHLAFTEINNIEETERLANLYIDRGIIPASKVADALHIAISTMANFDYLVSWNYKHLANVNREKKILAVNMQENYFHPLRIITPLELIDYGN